MGNSLGHSLEPIKPPCPRNYPCPGDVSSDRPGSDKRQINVPPLRRSEEQRVEYGVAKGTGVVASFPSMPILKPADDDPQRPNDRPTRRRQRRRLPYDEDDRLTLTLGRWTTRPTDDGHRGGDLFSLYAGEVSSDRPRSSAWSMAWLRAPRGDLFSLYAHSQARRQRGRPPSTIERPTDEEVEEATTLRRGRPTDAHPRTMDIGVVASF